MVGCFTLLGIGILCSYRCPGRSSHKVPTSLVIPTRITINMLFSILQLFISERISIKPLKARALRMAYLVCFRL